MQWEDDYLKKIKMVYQGLARPWDVDLWNRLRIQLEELYWRKMKTDLQGQAVLWVADRMYHSTCLDGNQRRISDQYTLTEVWDLRVFVNS